MKKKIIINISTRMLLKYILASNTLSMQSKKKIHQHLGPYYVRDFLIKYIIYRKT